MAMRYINYLKEKAPFPTSAKQEKPVLTEEDEQFLNRITSQDDSDPLKGLPVAGESTPRDAQIALMNGAQNIPLPETPQEEHPEITPESAGQEKPTEPESKKESKSRKAWTWVRRDSRDGRRKVCTSPLQS